MQDRWKEAYVRKNLDPSIQFDKTLTCSDRHRHGAIATTALA